MLLIERVNPFLGDKRKGAFFMVTVNGEPFAKAAGQNLLAFLQQRKTPVDNVVVELNGTIIHRPEYEQTLIKPDDKLELISFVGGGR